jgi:small subunit ribosomal protein S16
MSEVAIRLKRLGGKGKPHHRIVVMAKQRTRDGRTLEEIGHYDPSKHPPYVKIDIERAKFWMARGAKPSPTVERLMAKAQHLS